MHGLLEYMNTAGSMGAKATFVLNNMFARNILKPRDIEAALGTKIELDLPYDVGTDHAEGIGLLDDQRLLVVYDSPSPGRLIRDGVTADVVVLPDSSERVTAS